jgi:hypothetical protein
MWEKMSLPNYIADRFIGISLPFENEIAVVSYDGIHIINLTNSNKVFTDTDYPEGGELFDHKKNQLNYGNKIYKILGLYGGEPILNNTKGETIEIDIKRQELYIFNDKRKKILDFHYDDMSGDWCLGTFSEDGQYILLCLPYDLYIFKNKQ